MCQWMTLQEFSTLEFKTQFSKSTLTLELRVIMALKQLIDSGQVRLGQVYFWGGANLTWVKLLEAVAHATASSNLTQVRLAPQNKPNLTKPDLSQ